MFNETALSWAIVNMWLETRGDFHDIIPGFRCYIARFKGDPNRIFEGKTILEALQKAQQALEK